MLTNIKSSYLIKFIFSYIKEKQKLEMIKYNLTLQKSIDISLMNYRYFTGKIVVYNESKQITQEYLGYSDVLVFEGEYKNGKRNGKGKEFVEFSFDIDILKFEGEYLNGKRHGKGKEYDETSLKLKFEAEYLKGKRTGKGKEYYVDYRDEVYLIFEGEYLDDKELIGSKSDKYGNFLDKLNHTKGIGQEYEYNYGNLIYEGEYLNGKRHGKGKEYNSYKQLTFEGEYLDDLKWNGKGYDKSNNIVYELKNGKGFVKEYNYEHRNLEFEGEYLYGKRNGKGKEYSYLGELALVYEGEYLNGKRNGKGKKYFRNVLVFEGEYLEGKRYGKGKEYYNNGKLRFEGEYLYNYKLKGKFYVEGKLEYEGDYLYEKKYNGKGYDKNGNVIYELINGNGKVKEYFEFGGLIFDGEYLNGKRNGFGKEYSFDVLKYEGEFSDGKKNGFGKQYGSYGILNYEGQFLNGKKHGIGKEFHLNKKLKYEGQFINGKSQGKGKEYDSSGKLIFEGEFFDGKKHGIGKEFDSDGKIIFEGKFLGGVKV